MTEKELENNLQTACAMTLQRQRVLFATRVAKAYAAAQVAEAVTSGEQNMELMRKRKNGHIDFLKAEIASLKTNIEELTTKCLDAKHESRELRAEIKRLREGIENLWYNPEKYFTETYPLPEHPDKMQLEPRHVAFSALLADSPAPATEAPKNEAYSISRAKEVFAARHNLTWGGIMHQFEVGSGISKTFSLEEVMEKVAEIYKNEEQE